MFIRRLCLFITTFTVVLYSSFVVASPMTPIPHLKPAAAFAGSLLVEVKKGDTLSDILQTAGVTKNDIVYILQKLRPIYDPGKLRLGQKIRINFHISDKEDNLEFSSLTISESLDKNIEVTKLSHNTFSANELQKEHHIRLENAGAEIKSTLFSAAHKAGIPNSILLDLIKNYSYDVDFQRDIRKGNHIEVLFERLYDDEGEEAGVGNLVYASLELNNQNLTIYRYTTADGSSDYYDETGKSIKKSLLKTPVDGARITSKYGRRKHPILGYSKMHRGLDFGAPRGTPIYAAGDGIIQEIGRKGSYGNYIKIYHNNGYATAYAHMKKFGRKLKRGRKVKQGQIIGYVGTTGRSTGPHLHYEILVNNRHINPLSIKAVAGRQLKNLEYGIFHGYTKQVAALLSEDSVTRLAQAN